MLLSVKEKATADAVLVFLKSWKREYGVINMNTYNIIFTKFISSNV